jgi:hypothetical protein
MSKLGGRKFVTSIILLVLNFILFYNGRIDSKTWELLTSTIFGLYVAGNVIGKFGKK